MYQCSESKLYSYLVSIPSSVLAFLAPSPAKECVPPWNQGEESNTHLRVRGRREPIRTTVLKACHSVYFVQTT